MCIGVGLNTFFATYSEVVKPSSAQRGSLQVFGKLSSSHVSGQALTSVVSSCLKKDGMFSITLHSHFATRVFQSSGIL